MSNDKIVDGIVVNYNSHRIKHLVEKSISSLLELPCRRLYIVDNASKDGSYEFIKDKFSDEHRILLVRLDSNRGYAGAINYIYSRFKNSLTRGFFIANNDLVILEPSNVMKMLEMLENAPRIGALSGILLYPSGRVQSAGFLLNDLALLVNPCQGRTLDECDSQSAFSFVSFTSGAFTLINRDAVETMPQKIPFPSRGFMYLDDIIMGGKLWEKGFASIVLNEPIAVHYESLSTNSATKAFLLGRALAVQRKILIPCLVNRSLTNKIFLEIYARMVGTRLSKEKRIFYSFKKGFHVGLREYEMNKNYWNKYSIQIRKIYHIHGVWGLIERMSEYMRAQ
jgi:GT2 family glycosyltransferase